LCHVQYAAGAKHVAQNKASSTTTHQTFNDITKLLVRHSSSTLQQKRIPKAADTPEYSSGTRVQLAMHGREDLLLHFVKMSVHVTDEAQQVLPARRDTHAGLHVFQQIWVYFSAPIYASHGFCAAELELPCQAHILHVNQDLCALGRLTEGATLSSSPYHANIS